jgi:sarcosine oxidase gamma subunit
VVEYCPLRMAVILCCAEPAALDALTHSAAHACRVAPDELMLIDAPAQAQPLYTTARSGLHHVDPAALVLDVSAGWAAWQLSGDAAPAAFARVSAIPMTDGFAQGAVAGVPARVLVSGSVIILTASTLRHHVGRRVRESCADLHAVERPARDFSASEGA